MCDWDLNMWIDEKVVNTWMGSPCVNRSPACGWNLHLWTGPPHVNGTCMCKLDLQVCTGCCTCERDLFVCVNVTCMCECILHVLTGPPHVSGTSTSDWYLLIVNATCICEHDLICKCIHKWMGPSVCEWDLHLWMYPPFVNRSSTCEQDLNANPGTPFHIPILLHTTWHTIPHIT